MVVLKEIVQGQRRGRKHSNLEQNTEIALLGFGDLLTERYFVFITRL